MSTSLDYYFLKFNLHSELDENSDVSKRLNKDSHHVNIIK